MGFKAIRGASGGVRVTFEGKLKRRLEEFQKQGGDLRPVLHIIGQDLLRSTDQNFVAQGRKDAATRQWKGLSATTLERRRQAQVKDNKGKILQASGRLRGSIQRAVTSKYVEVGTTVEYGPEHQQRGKWGTSKRVRRRVRIPQHKRKMKVRRGSRLVSQEVTVKAHFQQQDYRLPARPFLWIHKKDMQRAGHRFRAWVMRDKRNPAGSDANVSGGVRGST